MAWKGDGNEGLSISGHSVQYGGGKGDAKGNALWTDQLASSSYVEFKVSGEPGTWVGVATEANFAAGWGLKGLFYGGPGNLSDGGSLVQSNWGPKFGAGDVIGMQVDQSADRVQIAFAKNGAGLGPAFDIAGWTAGPLHPTVSFNTAGQGWKRMSCCHGCQELCQQASRLLIGYNTRVSNSSNQSEVRSPS